MRIMLAIVALAALGWTGWWFFVANSKERAIAAWLEERRDDGWVAEAEAIEVAGFPYRVDTTLRELHLANPRAGWAWSAPEFQFLTLAYKPQHLIAIWPNEQTVATPAGEARIAADAMRGSVVVEPNPALALDRSSIEILGLTLTGDGGWEIGLDSALFATRQAGDGGAPFAHDISFTAEELSLPQDWTRSLDRSGVLAPVIETARVEATAVFDRAWDRPAIEGEHPALEALAIRDMTFTWGRLDLRGRGELRADERGFAEGRLDLRARNWREMVDLAEQAGAVGSTVASGLRTGLGLFARLGGDPDTLEAPLEFARGRVSLGPVPIGDAPRLRGAAP